MQLHSETCRFGYAGMQFDLKQYIDVTVRYHQTYIVCFTNIYAFN